MEKILVPVDFSDTSVKAVMYGAAIAFKTNAALCLLHVVQPPPISYSDLPVPYTALTEEQITAASEKMEPLKKEILRDYPDLDLTSAVLEGDARGTINDFATAGNFDLIVMGTHGASGIQGFIWSSLTAKTLMHAAVPVVAVPAGYQLSEPMKILFATNRFEEDPALLEPIFRFSKIFNATIHVVIFLDKDKAKGYEYLEAGKNLARYHSFLKAKYPDIVIQPELIDGSDFEHAMELYEGRQEIDLIAMITYPKGFFEKLAGKTVTKKMTMHSRIPVLAIPSRTNAATNKFSKSRI